MLNRLKRVAEIAVVTSALLYVAGWGYLYAYFHEFGISVGDLSLPVQISLIFSVPVLLRWWVILIIVVAFTAFAGLSLIKQLDSFFKHFDVVFTIALLLLTGKMISMWGAYLGDQQAKLERYSSTSNLPQATFVLKTSSPSCLRDSADPRLLLHANSQYYILRAIGPSPTGSEGRSMTVCIIPDDQVQSVTLIVGI
jgi:hypothetical protein